jgi:dihydroorotase
MCVDGPAFDLLTTMSKFLCLGVGLSAVIAAATQHAARALQRPELGTLKPGAVGDASILRLESGRFDYVDSTGARLAGEQRIAAVGAVIGGR